MDDQQPIDGSFIHEQAVRDLCDIDAHTLLAWIWQGGLQWHADPNGEIWFKATDIREFLKTLHARADEIERDEHLQRFVTIN